MNKAAKHIAVLLFTRTSTEEARVKRFCQSKSQSKAVVTKLITHTKQVVQQAGLPLVVIDSGKQQGNNFGDRLQHAIQQVVARGYEQVICLGNDAPGLRPETLRAAATALQQNEFVFGEAADGGVYLMGRHHHSLPLLNFDAISWNTSLVFEQLCQQSSVAATAILKPILSDADDAAVVLAFSVQRKLGRFADWLYSLLAGIKFNLTSDTLFTSQATSNVFGLRAPPAL